MHWRDEIILKLPSQHDDEPRDLRQDILDELEDHLECAMQRELRRVDDEQIARRRVLARFGNPANIARRLWLDAMKGRLMNQRIMLGTNVLLAVVTITMCIVVLFALRDSMRAQQAIAVQMEQTMTELARQRQQPPAEGSAIPAAIVTENEKQAETDIQPPHDELRTQWLERLASLTDNWRLAYAAGNELVMLPPDEGFAILRDNWDRIEHISSRQQIVKAFAFTAMGDMHPHIIDVMHMAMSDESSEVQSWGMSYLKWIAFEDFARDYRAYERWRERHRDQSPQQTIIASMNDWTERLGEGDDDARAILREGNLLTLRDQPWMHEAALQSDLPDVLAGIIQAGAVPRAGSRAHADAVGALLRVRELRMDEQYLRRVVLPIITADRPPEQLLDSAYVSLQGRENAWAKDIMLDQLKRAVLMGNRRMRSYIFSIASAIASYQDPTVIPTLIKLIDFDNTYDTIYGIGYFGLHPLTGVSYDEAHNGAWWREWWETNRERFPESTREIEIGNPKDERTERENRTDKQFGLRHAGGDKTKAYFLIGADREPAPDRGYKLLLVLPGGDGSEDFHPFVRNIHANALGEDWVIAQLVAPVWDPQQPNVVVWPTRGLPWEGMQFSTEEFVDAVIEDVMHQHAIDERHIYALGWSSGGPPVYAISMRKEAKLRGAFVAMSVFHQQQYPDPANAKGRSFYLLHSPEDFIQMRFPEQAKRTLSEAGANVVLVTYDGGHGWHGDVFGMIRLGVEWLVAQSTTVDD